MKSPLSGTEVGREKGGAKKVGEKDGAKKMGRKRWGEKDGARLSERAGQKEFAKASQEVAKIAESLFVPHFVATLNRPG